jgi:transcriptional regulator with XRE-family HTH domain
MVPANDLRQTLAHNIRSARERRRLSQAKLAAAAEISFPHMSDIEYCKTWVSDKTLIKLAAALRVEPWQLLKPAESPEPVPGGRDTARAVLDELQTEVDQLFQRTASRL